MEANENGVDPVRLLVAARERIAALEEENARLRRQLEANLGNEGEPEQPAAASMRAARRQ